jgi:hypothetical protein
MRRPARKPPPPKTPPQPGTPAQTAPPAAQTAPQPAQADTPAQAAPRFITSPHPVSPKPPPLRERVSELHRAGFSEDLIAVRLGISVTEARLYIAMGG